MTLLEPCRATHPPELRGPGRHGAEDRREPAGAARITGSDDALELLRDEVLLILLRRVALSRAEGPSPIPGSPAPQGSGCAHLEARGAGLLRPAREDLQLGEAQPPDRGPGPAEPRHLGASARGRWRRALARLERAMEQRTGAGCSDRARALGELVEAALALEPRRAGATIHLVPRSSQSARARTGAHYTPEALVDALVRPALGLVFREAWRAARGELPAYEARLVALRILDPAAGNGAFLAAAARLIATELAFARRFGAPRHLERPEVHEPCAGPWHLPEALRPEVARLLPEVLRRSCYGVDVNPLAVELGRLSLWLAAKAELAPEGTSDLPHGFMDQNLRCGDALIGVVRDEARTSLLRRLGVALPAEALEPALLDLATLADYFEVGPGKLGVSNGEALKGALGLTGVDWGALLAGFGEPRFAPARHSIHQLAMNAALVAGRPLRTFHWALAFPEVFSGPEPGFDLILANPPFAGDRELRARLGEATTRHLVERHAARRAGGTCDLAGFFVLRMDDLAKARSGVVAVIAPNTLAQAKNRRAVLEPLTSSTDGPPRFRIARALPSRSWPGDASVHVSLLWLARPEVPVEPTLLAAGGGGRWTPRAVARISSQLAEGTLLAPLRPLPSGRIGVFRQGMIHRGVAGSGDFVKRGDLAAALLAEATRGGERAALRAYLNNDLLQHRRAPLAEAIAVDFYDVLVDAGLLEAEPEAQLAWLEARFPICLGALHGVKAARLALPASASNAKDRARWWMYNSPRPELRRLWADAPSVVLVGAGASKVWCLTRVPRIDPRLELPISPSHTLNVLPSASAAAFAVLQSTVGELFVRRHGSTLKSDLRFTPEYALAAFPFPWPSRCSEAARGPWPLPPPAGAEARLRPPLEHLLALRQRLLWEPELHLPELAAAPKRWGVTALYNRFDDPGCDWPALEALRAAHRRLLDLVLAVYADDQTLGEAAATFAELRRRMRADADRGWAFERPWIDGAPRYIPRQSHRAALEAALLAANRARYEQERALVP